MSRTTTDQLIAVVSELTKLDRRGKEYVLTWLSGEVKKADRKAMRQTPQPKQESEQ